MLTYSQSTGELRDGGTTLGKGWAGRGAGKNNPAMQDVKSTGPLPQGFYQIQAPVNHPRLGPLAFYLSPDPENQMFGRDGFYIHGASMDPATRGQESKGCPIQARATREALVAYVGQNLQVIP